MIQKRNLSILVAAQAIVGAQFPINIILGGLAGALLAEDRAYATLPISIVVLTSTLAAPISSMIMGRFGRRAGFLLGTAAGVCAGITAVRALSIGSFGLFLVSSCCFGLAQSIQGFYRFAASETATGEAQPKAISWVLGGGLISALIGPEIVRQLSDAMLPVQFAGAYAAVIAINLAGACVIAFLAIPLQKHEPGAAGDARPLKAIFSDRRVIVAVTCAMISYAVMSLVMTSTPLAMVTSGFHSNHAADVVRWHVIAMFAPSFFTGSLIARYGHRPVIATGLVLLAACAIIALAGVNLHQFYLALIALGIGWNFAFIGATSLLATAHTSAERTKVQGLNDFLVFGLVAAASFSSGALLNAFGWNAVQLAAIPAVAVAAIVLLWLTLTDRRATRPTARQTVDAAAP